MAWHNHEENIEMADQFLEDLTQSNEIENYFMGKCVRLLLIHLLKSMIADAETGHKRIEKLQSGQPNRTICLKRISELEAENEALKKQVSDIEQILTNQKIV